MIGDKAANVFTNADILALPDGERQAGILGAVTLMAQTAAAQEGNAARCITDWYFTVRRTHTLVVATMQKYPEERASGTIYGLIAMSCKELQRPN